MRIIVDELDFKKFYETYFNYPYDKLISYEFDDLVRIQRQIACSYDCRTDDVECILLFKKISPVIKHDDGYGGFIEDRYDLQFYGFYRINKSNFYIPFNVCIENRYVLPIVQLDLNYSINNSVFDYIHFPLKKEKTEEFYQQLIQHSPFDVSYAVFNSEIMVLAEPIRRRTIYIDFHNHLFDLCNRGQFFNEHLTVCYKAYNEIGLYFDYELNYYLKSEREHLFIKSKKLSDFNKANFLYQSFSGVDLLCGFHYITINELDALVKRYRQIEEMYVI